MGRPFCSWEVVLASIASLSILCESALIVSTVLRMAKQGDVDCWQAILSSVLSFWLVWNVLLGVIASLVDGISLKRRLWAIIACFLLVVVLTLRILMITQLEPSVPLHGLGFEPLSYAGERLLCAAGAIATSVSVVAYIVHHKLFDHGELDQPSNPLFRLAVLLSILFQLLGLVLYCDTWSRRRHLDILASIVYALIATLSGSILLVGMDVIKKPVIITASFLIMVIFNIVSFISLPARQTDEDRFFFGVLITICIVGVLLAGVMRRIRL